MSGRGEERINVQSLPVGAVSASPLHLSTSTGVPQGPVLGPVLFPITLRMEPKLYADQTFSWASTQQSVHNRQMGGGCGQYIYIYMFIYNDYC